MPFLGSSFVDGTLMTRSAWLTYMSGPGLWLRGMVQPSDIADRSIDSVNIVRPYIASDPLNIFDGTIQQASWRTEADSGVYWNALTDRKDVFYDQHVASRVVVPDMCATISAEREADLSATNRLLVLVQADVSVGAWSDCQFIEEHVFATAGLFPFLAGRLRLAQKDSSNDEWTLLGQPRNVFQSYRALTHLTSNKWNSLRGNRDGDGRFRNVRRMVPRDKWNFTLAAGFVLEDSIQKDVGLLLDFGGVYGFNQSKYIKQKDQVVASQQFTFGPRSLKIECFRSR